MHISDSRDGKLMLLNSAIAVETPWQSDRSMVKKGTKEQQMVELYNKLKPKAGNG